MPHSPLIPLKPAFKDYAWGKLGDSWVRLFAGEAANEQTPCAEIWFGDHNNGAALASFEGKQYPLPELLQSQPELNGGKPQLSFLAKVLSIGKPLSIQLHPSSIEAKRLHQLRPDQYPDEGQKDEAAVALSQTRLLYGFRSKEEILSSLNQHQEFLPLFDALEELSDENFNRALCLRLFSFSDQDLVELCQGHQKKLESNTSTYGLEESLFLEASKEFSAGDVGLLFCYLLNYVELEEGESISIPAGRPHAYLSGELLEIMFPSDNVIRCGLTPKFKDPQEIAKCAEFRPVTQDEHSSLPYSFHKESLNIQLLTDSSFNFQRSKEAQIIVNLDAIGSLSVDGVAQQLKAQSCFLLPGNRLLEGKLSSGRLIVFSAALE